MSTYRLIIKDAYDHRMRGTYIQIPFNSVREAVKYAYGWSKDQGHDDGLLVEIYRICAPIQLVRSGQLSKGEIKWKVRSL